MHRRSGTLRASSSLRIGSRLPLVIRMITLLATRNAPSFKSVSCQLQKKTGHRSPGLFAPVFGFAPRRHCLSKVCTPFQDFQGSPIRMTKARAPGPGAISFSAVREGRQRRAYAGTVGMGWGNGRRSMVWRSLSGMMMRRGSRLPAYVENAGWSLSRVVPYINKGCSSSFPALTDNFQGISKAKGAVRA